MTEASEDTEAAAVATEIVKLLSGLSYFDESVSFEDRIQAAKYVEPIIERLKHSLAEVAKEEETDND